MIADRLMLVLLGQTAGIEQISCDNQKGARCAPPVMYGFSHQDRGPNPSR
jgi:hypothetical protein